MQPLQLQSVRATLRSPRRLKTEALAGLVVALALIPEAIAFSVIAGVDPRIGLFASFTMAVTISFVGGRPAMISAATGAVALVIAPLMRSHGLDHLIAAVILAGVFQILLAVLGVTRLMRFIPRSVMVGFVNALAILVFMAQIPELIGVPWMVYPLVAIGLVIVVLLPRITTAVPSPLVAIVLLTAFVVVAGVDVPAVQDKGQLPESLPSLFIPNVPLTWETFQVIAPFSLSMALVGLLESLMTAKLVDDITDTRSNKTRESWGQGVANIVTGFLGGMGGCAVIGQTMINVKGSGARSRVSTFLSGVFLLILVVLLGDVVGLIPMAALVAVMIFVSAITFDWHSIAPRTLRRMPKSETAVMVITVAVVSATHNLAIGVGAGRARSDGHVRPAGGPLRHRRADRGGTERRGRGHLHRGRRAVLRLLQRPLHPVRVRTGRRAGHQPGSDRPARLPPVGRLHHRGAGRRHREVPPARAGSGADRAELGEHPDARTAGGKAQLTPAVERR